MAFNECTECVKSIAMNFILMRKDKGLDKNQVSEKSGMSIYLLGKLESPTNNKVRICDIEDYAAALGKKVIVSFEDED